MYTTCPKCAYERRVTDTNSPDQCPGCGLVFSKWLKSLVTESEEVPVSIAPTSRRTWHAWLLPARPTLTRPEFFVYCLLFVVFLVWGLSFISMDIGSNEIGRSWFHNINLVFHEAGHVLFRPFGRLWMFLGGSLFQVLLPLMLMASFLIYNRDAFGASLCLWWAGQSLMDVAPYIADARALNLPLLGVGASADAPGMHDWYNILRMQGWLLYDTAIARWVDLAGMCLMLVALFWGAMALRRYWQQLCSGN